MIRSLQLLLRYVKGISQDYLVFLLAVLITKRLLPSRSSGLKGSENYFT